MTFLQNAAVNRFVARLLSDAIAILPHILGSLPHNSGRNLLDLLGTVGLYFQPKTRVSGMMGCSVELIMAASRSANCPRESVLPIRLRSDFSVVLEGYAEGAEHRALRQVARKLSLWADILRTC